MEVIFFSADRDEKAFNEYFETMPWLSIPFTDKKREEKLSAHFNVSGIPCLVILDPKDLSIINKNATGKVRGDKEGAGFPWAPNVVKEIDAEPQGIDEGLSLVVLQENTGTDEKENNISKVLKPVAEKYKGVKLSKDAEVMFFHASTEGGRLAERVRNVCKVTKNDDSKPNVVLMNIPDNTYYEYKYDSLTVENLEKFFDSVKANSLESKIMSA